MRKNMVDATEINQEKYTQTVHQIDGVTIGRIILPYQFPDTWIPSKTCIEYMNLLNGRKDDNERFRRSLVFSMNWNTPSQNSRFSHESAASAYFTYRPETTAESGQPLEEEAVIIEWVLGIPKLPKKKLKTSPHYYLNQVINHEERARQGMRISSGHLAKIPETDEYLALFDCLQSSTELNQDHPLGRSINTLHSYGFIPITADGYVKHPAF